MPEATTNGLLTDQQANAIFEVLVREAGASEQDRSHFIIDTTSRGLTEWRFGGKLGFGGKVRRAGWRERIYVTAYPEDMTPVRAEVVERTNAALRGVLRMNLDERI